MTLKGIFAIKLITPTSPNSCRQGRSQHLLTSTAASWIGHVAEAPGTALSNMDSVSVHIGGAPEMDRWRLIVQKIMLLEEVTRQVSHNNGGCPKFPDYSLVTRKRLDCLQSRVTALLFAN